MKIVIDIPNKIYNALTHTEFDANLVVDEMRKSIVHGNPLPKGHGRLFDERDVYEKICPHVYNGVLDDIMFSLTPIIDADKE